MRESLRALWITIATPFRAAPAHAVATVTLTGIGALFAPVFAYAMKLITDGVVTQDMGLALTGAALVGGMAGLVFLTSGIGITTIRMAMEERTRLYIERRIIDLVTGVHGLEHHERPEYLNELTLLRAQRGQLAQPSGPVVFLFTVLVQGGATLALLAGLHPLLLVLPAFGVPSLLAGLRAQRIWDDAMERTAEPQRLRDHLFDLLTTAAEAKEVRVFGLQDELIDREAEQQEFLIGETTRAAVRGSVLENLGWLVFAAGYVGAVGFVVLLAMQGRATIGDVMLTTSLAAQVNGMVATTSSMSRWLRRVLRVVRRYIWLEDYAERSRSEPDDPAPVPERITRGIEIEDVSFRYPGTDRDVLEGLTVRIPAGSTVAIVGENGVGKTTLVKLLCRFYDPDSGVIRVDGVDLRRLDPEEWRARMSAGFQDFAKLELLARENVGVGDLPAMQTPGRVESALDRASATDVLDSLPAGLETQLGRSFDDGVELSGGEWQKLALGRAMMREVPLLLVLDEPTASLDAPTEHALFERYAHAARTGSATNGAITVLVSHRFSTVRMADLILVVECGRVVELGSHDELMEKDGLYAELYSIQARAYR